MCSKLFQSSWWELYSHPSTDFWELFWCPLSSTPFPFTHMQISTKPKDSRGLLIDFCSPLSVKLPLLLSLQILATVASPKATSAALFNKTTCSFPWTAAWELPPGARLGCCGAHLTLSTFWRGSQASACHKSQNYSFIYILQFLDVEGRGVHLVLAVPPQQKAEVFTLKTHLPFKNNYFL